MKIKNLLKETKEEPCCEMPEREGVFNKGRGVFAKSKKVANSMNKEKEEQTK